MIETLNLQDILAFLLEKHSMSESRLGKEVNIPRATINRIISGKTPDPRISTLKPIAAYFDISIDQLLGHQHLEATPESQSPILEIDQLADTDIEEIMRLASRDQLHEKNLPKNAFTVKVTGDAMYPQFKEGSILIINPDLEPKNRNFILAKLQEQNRVVFRQFIIDGNHKYLIPVNTVFPTLKVENEDVILGVVIQTRQNLE